MPSPALRTYAGLGIAPDSLVPQRLTLPGISTRAMALLCEQLAIPVTELDATVLANLVSSNGLKPPAIRKNNPMDVLHDPNEHTALTYERIFRIGGPGLTEHREAHLTWESLNERHFEVGTPAQAWPSANPNATDISRGDAYSFIWRNLSQVSPPGVKSQARMELDAILASLEILSSSDIATERAHFNDRIDLEVAPPAEISSLGNLSRLPRLKLLCAALSESETKDEIASNIFGALSDYTEGVVRHPSSWRSDLGVKQLRAIGDAPLRQSAEHEYEIRRIGQVFLIDGPETTGTSALLEFKSLATLRRQLSSGVVPFRSCQPLSLQIEAPRPEVLLSLAESQGLSLPQKLASDLISFVDGEGEFDAEALFSLAARSQCFQLRLLDYLTRTPSITGVAHSAAREARLIFQHSSGPFTEITLTKPEDSSTRLREHPTMLSLRHRTSELLTSDVVPLSWEEAEQCSKLVGGYTLNKSVAPARVDPERRIWMVAGRDIEIELTVPTQA